MGKFSIGPTGTFVIFATIFTADFRVFTFVISPLYFILDSIFLAHLKYETQKKEVFLVYLRDELFVHILFATIMITVCWLEKDRELQIFFQSDDQKKSSNRLQQVLNMQKDSLIVLEQNLSPPAQQLQANG